MQSARVQKRVSEAQKRVDNARLFDSEGDVLQSIANLHRHHIQGDILQSIAKAIRQSPSPIHFLKVKSHAGNIGNEHADALAKKSATNYSDIADTSI